MGLINNLMDRFKNAEFRVSGYFRLVDNHNQE